MTICPIAIAVGCKKCPAFKFCPLTTVLGDQEEKDEYQRYAEEELEKNTKQGVKHMTICPIALAVGCEKCPAFSFCSLTTVLGDQQEEDEVDPSNKVWEENFPPKKNKNEDAGEE